MKFTLKDYQRDAVRDALDNLKDAQDDWRRKSRKCAFSLTAVTGAGKTVMAAAAFEALFHGDDEFDFDDRCCQSSSDGQGRSMVAGGRGKAQR